MSIATEREATVSGIRELAAKLESTLAMLPGALWQRWLSFAVVEQMFILLRLLTIPGVLAWLWFDPDRARLFTGIIGLLVFFTLYSSVVHIAAFTLSTDRLHRIQFLEIVCDILFITLLLNKTGTVGGIFQLGYILLIVFSSYYFTLRPTLALVFLISALSLFVNAQNRLNIYWGDLALLAGFEVLVAVGVGAIARRDRREKERIESLNRELQLKTAELTQAYRGIISSWAAAVDAKDTYTRGHAERVSRLARAIAEAMALPPEEIDKIAIAALLHDVGKIAIPDAVLGKPGSLTNEERLVVREHALEGAEMIGRIELLRDLAPLIQFHHERADGSGYPRGARLDEIPLGARIIGVADVYDAMTSERTYRRALRQEQAIAELTIGSRAGFDPEVVKVFLTLLEKTPRLTRGR